MTYLEALRILKRDLDLCLFNPITGKTEPMNEDCRLSAEALKVAIKCTELQIKQAVHIDYYDTLDYICPRCGNRVGTHDAHCKECGQALKGNDMNYVLC